MDNKYSNGIVAHRGDIVSTKGGLYVVVDSIYRDGLIFLAAVEPPFGYTRRAPAADCQIVVPGSEIVRAAIDVLAGFP
jgi:hypothetical protein